jgi:hypothetical protein
VGDRVVSVCFDRVKPLVDETVRRLAVNAFRDDPIAGGHYARATSIVSSAYNRHGKILEAAIFERLRDNNRLSVWSDPTFAVSPAADALVGSSTRADCFKSQLPYGETKRTLQIDIVVYDNLHRSLRTYEVKRGNGQHDAGKVRSIMRDLICTHVLLKSYGEGRGHGVDHAEAKIIYYYGVRSVPAPISLVREELDDHFEYPVVDAVEQVNTYFRDRLHELLERADPTDELLQ